MIDRLQKFTAWRRVGAQQRRATMTDAPKKIWASIRAEYASGLSGDWATDQSTVYPELEIPYIREDFAQARIAELEAALTGLVNAFENRMLGMDKAKARALAALNLQPED
jgi:hypothetical protein